jgi:hypothetical protein
MVEVNVFLARSEDRAAFNLVCCTDLAAPSLASAHNHHQLAAGGISVEADCAAVLG